MLEVGKLLELINEHIDNFTQIFFLFKYDHHNIALDRNATSLNLHCWGLVHLEYTKTTIGKQPQIFKISHEFHLRKYWI